ncbi:hypothetical protein ABBQ32_011786 [Trebouxia sp. C0010 RCD-2024]
MQASSAGRARLSSDVPDSQPAWMALSRGRRQHWSQRQLQQQAQQQQQPSQQPQPHHSDRAAIGDTVDVLAPPASHPQLSEWRRVWELASAAYFNRQHRVLWWRILHGCVIFFFFFFFLNFFFFFFFFFWVGELFITSMKTHMQRKNHKGNV